ncbi:MAG: YihY/virulence factor BrkB family protein [Lachnospiraceae bacterium]|nr:YihY/virulence factor BrkB family protein [Lachnospiraceae bacterium]
MKNTGETDFTGSMKITKQGLKKTVFKFAYGMSYKDIAAYASSTAFFFFIAMIPLLILLSKLLPLTGITDDQLIQIISGFTPEFANLIIVLVVKQAYASADSIFPISAAVLVYAIARGMLSLLRGLNVIYEVKEKKSGFVLTVRAIISTLLMVVNLAVFFVVLVFGGTIMEFFVEHIKVLESVPLIFSFRYLFIMALGVGIFMIMYAFLPAERQRFKRQLPGAVFSAVGWVVFSFFFSLFMGSSIYSTYYGGLATIVIFLMWLYGCFYILLIGANLNHSMWGT